MKCQDPVAAAPNDEREDELIDIPSGNFVLDPFIQEADGPLHDFVRLLKIGWE